MLILALDGLDFNLVNEFGLTNLMQYDFGRLIVPINNVHAQPLSPEVWASFLAGKHIVKEFEGRKHSTALKVLIRAKKFLPFVKLGLAKKVSGTPKGFPPRDFETWATQKRVQCVNVPYINYNNEVFEYLSKTKDLDLVKFRGVLTKNFRWSKMVFRQAYDTSRPFKVKFYYMNFPDQYQHILDVTDELKRHYEALDRFVVKLTRGYKKEKVYIISDHGYDFKEQKHSDFGFVSCNKFGPLPSDIIEFGKQIWGLAK